MKNYIGIDNGVNATIGFLHACGEYEIVMLPVKNEQSYTKKAQNISRVDWKELLKLLGGFSDIPTIVVIEQPMINPEMFKSSLSAVRTLEACTVCMEMLNLPYTHIYAKTWQKLLLPEGITSDKTKKASLDLGNRLFPKCADFKHKDRDGLMIAEYAKRMNL